MGLCPMLAWGFRPSGAPTGSPNRAGRNSLSRLLPPAPVQFCTRHMPLNTVLLHVVDLPLIGTSSCQWPSLPHHAHDTLPLNPLLGHLLQEAFPDSRVWGRSSSPGDQNSPRLPCQHVSPLPTFRTVPFLILCPALEFHEDRGLVCPSITMSSGSSTGLGWPLEGIPTLNIC